MTILRAKLAPIGHGMAEGQLTGHPDPDMLVRTHRTAPDRLSVSMWHKGDPGDMLVGCGELVCGDDGWRGDCQEGRAKWLLRGVDGGVEFRDPGEGAG